MAFMGAASLTWKEDIGLTSANPTEDFHCRAQGRLQEASFNSRAGATRQARRRRKEFGVDKGRLTKDQLGFFATQRSEA